MRPLVFVLPHALVFWAIDLWAFAPEFAIVARARKAAAENSSKDSGSLQLIVMGMWVGMLISFPISFVRPLRFPLWIVPPAFYIGSGTLLAGSLLRRHCWRVLGEYFTGEVRARTNQPVIDRGAYRWVRHPSYSGGILMFAGIGMELGSWASLAIVTFVAVTVYAYRIHIEERALIQAIGAPYIAYMRTRKRIIPFII